jgi:hypothetical protein
MWDGGAGGRCHQCSLTSLHRCWGNVPGHQVTRRWCRSWLPCANMPSNKSTCKGDRLALPKSPIPPKPPRQPQPQPEWLVGTQTHHCWQPRRVIEARQGPASLLQPVVHHSPQVGVVVNRGAVAHSPRWVRHQGHGRTVGKRDIQLGDEGQGALGAVGARNQQSTSKAQSAKRKRKHTGMRHQTITNRADGGPVGGDLSQVGEGRGG